MKNLFLSLTILLSFFLSSCEEDAPDTLGDLVVNLHAISPGTNPLIDTLHLGIFPIESMQMNSYVLNNAFKSAEVELEEERVVFTNILPGTYVVAFVATMPDEDVPKQVFQITADDVTVADLYF